MAPETFLSLVEAFIIEVKSNKQAQLNMSAEQFQYFWTRLEHVLGVTEVNRCARAICRQCGHEHLMTEWFHHSRTGRVHSGKCGHVMNDLLVAWSE